MAAGRPYEDEVQLQQAARRRWDDLSRADWLEAFGRHPKIGDKESIRKKLSEQAQVSEASEAVLEGLEKGNSEYQKRFGFIFIVCAAGKSAEKMLQLLKERLRHEPKHELYVAAAEQAAIMKLRVEKLLKDHE